MKKLIFVILSVIIISGCFSACSSNRLTTDKNSSKKIKIVTTIFPEYDWVMNIIGNDSGNAEITMLLDKGVDLHSFQPTADDILKVSNCDLFIYVGGESDGWVEGVLKESINKNMKVLNLLEILGDTVKEEEVIEGMQEDEHDHEHNEHDDHELENETEYDEHVWLSLKNAEKIVNAIKDTLVEIDQTNADKYRNNAKAYTQKLTELDSKYSKTVSETSVKTLLFGDRFPFRYLTDDYGLSYYAAFIGCSAETEASFETISFLSKKLDELSLRTVLTIEGTDHRIAETIIRNSKSQNQKILTMDSMQSVTANDVANGTTYLSVMEKNLEVLKEALKI